MSAAGPNTDRCQEEFSFTVSIFLFYFVKTFALCCPANSIIRNIFSNYIKNHSWRWLFPEKVFHLIWTHLIGTDSILKKLLENQFAIVQRKVWDLIRTVVISFS